MRPTGLRVFVTTAAVLVVVSTGVGLVSQNVGGSQRWFAALSALDTTNTEADSADSKETAGPAGIGKPLPHADEQVQSASGEGATTPQRQPAHHSHSHKRLRPPPKPKPKRADQGTAGTVAKHRYRVTAGGSSAHAAVASGAATSPSTAASDTGVLTEKQWHEKLHEAKRQRERLLPCVPAPSPKHLWVEPWNRRDANTCCEGNRKDKYTCFHKVLTRGAQDMQTVTNTEVESYPARVPFARVYVTYRGTSKSREQLFLQQLRSVGIRKASLVKAFDVKAVTESDSVCLYAHSHLRAHFDDTTAEHRQVQQHDKLGGGDNAHTAKGFVSLEEESHAMKVYTALYDMVQRGLPAALILSDEMTLSERFVQQLTDHFDREPRLWLLDWDVLHLGTHGAVQDYRDAVTHSKRNAKQSDQRQVPQGLLRMHRHAGHSSFMISLRGAMELLALLPFSNPLGHEWNRALESLDSNCPADRHMNVYWTEEPLAVSSLTQ